MSSNDLGSLRSTKVSLFDDPDFDKLSSLNESIINSVVSKNVINQSNIVQTLVPIPSAKAVKAASADPNNPNAPQGKYVNEYPTDLLVDRFHKWRKILKGLIVYFKEVAYAQEEIARINHRLKSSVKFPFLTDLDDETNMVFDPMRRSAAGPKSQAKAKGTAGEDQSVKDDGDVYMAVDDDSSAPSGFMKFGSGSVQDVQIILKKYHLCLANQQFKLSKDILINLIPKLEALRKDLSLKIKDIKSLSHDFRTNLKAHTDTSVKLLNKYVASLAVLSTTNETERKKLIKISKPKYDPYLLKLQLELQMKRQLTEENYLKEAYINLQTSGMKLEKVIFTKIQSSLQRYSVLIDSESKISIQTLCTELQSGITSKPPILEWDHFVTHHPDSFIRWKSSDPIPVKRTLSKIYFPEMKSPLSKCLKAGYLNKKSEFSPSYKSRYYVLTANYLHEFPNENFFKAVKETGSHPNPLSTREAVEPIMSFNLNECVFEQISEREFTIVGKPTVGEPPRVSTTSSKNSNASISSTSALPPKKSSTSSSKDETKKKCGITKTSAAIIGGGSAIIGGGSAAIIGGSASVIGGSATMIGGMLKAGGSKVKSSSSAQTSVKPSTEAQIYLAKASQNPDMKEYVWKFKLPRENVTEEESKMFKKWMQDLKKLVAFDNTLERRNFIETRLAQSERVRKAKASALKNSSSQLNSADFGQNIRVASSSAGAPSIDDSLGSWGSTSMNGQTSAMTDQSNHLAINMARNSSQDYSDVASRNSEMSQLSQGSSIAGSTFSFSGEQLLPSVESSIMKSPKTIKTELGPDHAGYFDIKIGNNGVKTPSISNLTEQIPESVLNQMQNDEGINTAAIATYAASNLPELPELNEIREHIEQMDIIETPVLAVDPNLEFADDADEMINLNQPLYTEED